MTCDALHTDTKISTQKREKFTGSHSAPSIIHIQKSHYKNRKIFFREQKVHYCNLKIPFQTLPQQQNNKTNERKTRSRRT